jgi:hypothetical protein
MKVSVPSGKEAAKRNKSSQVQVAPEDRIRVETLFKSSNYGLDQVGQIVARTLGFKNVKAKRVRFTREGEGSRYKYCEDYGEMGCGCIKDPPGISFVCGPGDI